MSVGISEKPRDKALIRALSAMSKNVKEICIKRYNFNLVID